MKQNNTAPFRRGINRREFIKALKDLTEKKGLSETEIKEYLEAVFAKAFSKKDSEHSLEEKEIEIEEAKFKVDLDVKKGDFKLWREFIIIDEDFDDKEAIYKISKNDPKVKKLKLSVNDLYLEEIDWNEFISRRINYIKQLLVQKVRESEKLKIYEKFRSKKGELINAKITKIENNYVLLEYQDITVFMPKSETSPLDKLKLNQLLKVYVINVDKQSKYAQIIVSRKNENLLRKVLELEINDIANGIIKIEKIVRAAGFKSKILVSSSVDEIDPVGSIIGVKGKKIKPIIDELSGERIDIIKYSDNPKQILSQAILPAKLEGIIEKKAENGETYYILVVQKDNFLAAIGRRGVNIKLVSSLVNAKIDVKKIEDAKNEGLHWEKVNNNDFQNKHKNTRNKRLTFDEIKKEYDFDLEDFQDMGDEYE